jgi:mannose-6-phosphate isomerase-like protein (cupin superfamily)
MVRLSPSAIAALQGLAVPAGAPHRVHNASAEAADFLVVSQPPSQGDRVAAP